MIWCILATTYALKQVPVNDAQVEYGECEVDLSIFTSGSISLMGDSVTCKRGGQVAVIAQSASSSGNLLVYDCSFLEITASYLFPYGGSNVWPGGAVLAYNLASVRILNTGFVSCVAQYGGAVAVICQQIDMVGCGFSDCVAEVAGNDMLLSSPSATITDCCMESRDSTYSVFLLGGYGAEFKNCEFSADSSDTAIGGGDESLVTLENCSWGASGCVTIHYPDTGSASSKTKTIIVVITVIVGVIGLGIVGFVLWRFCKAGRQESDKADLTDSLID